MKRSTNFAGLFGVILSVGVLAPAQAQLVNGKWQLSPITGSSGRTAVATPQREPVGGTQGFVGQTGLGGQTAFGGPTVFGDQRGFNQRPVAFLMVPAFLMSDGTVLANFGMGFEPVTRACGGYATVSTQPTVMLGNGAVLQQQVNVRQTASGQTTASQMYRGQPRYPILTSASQTACFSRDQSGRFFVIRQ